MSRTKIVSTVSLLIVFFLVGSLSFWVLQRVKQRAKQFTQITVRRLGLVGRINAYQAEGYVQTLLFLMTDSPEKRASLRVAIEDYRQKTSVLLSQYEALLTTGGARRRYEDLTEKRKQYHMIREQIIALSDQNKKDECIQLTQISLGPAYQQYTLAGDVLFDDDISAVAASTNVLLKACTIAQFMAAFISIGGFIGGVIVPFVLMWLRHPRQNDPVYWTR